MSSAGQTAPGLPPILPTLIALGLVYALIRWGVPFAAKFFTKNSTRSEMIAVRESATLGTQQVHLVSVMGRVLLIGTSPNGTSLLADLTETPTAPNTIFAEVLHSEVQHPPAPYEVVNSTEPDADRVNEALARLERLMGA